MLLSEAVGYERSKNALFDKLAEYPYMLHKESLRKLMQGELTLQQEGARYSYTQKLLTYLYEQKELAISVADTDSAKRIVQVVAEASWMYFGAKSCAK